MKFYIWFEPVLTFNEKCQVLLRKSFHAFNEFSPVASYFLFVLFCYECSVKPKETVKQEEEKN